MTAPDLPYPKPDPRPVMPPRPTGDFAAGQETRPILPTHADFATGEHALPVTETAGDFATGEHTLPAAPVIPGDFATGQEAAPSPPQGLAGCSPAPLAKDPFFHGQA